MATAEELVVRASLRDELTRPVRALKREVAGLATGLTGADVKARSTTSSLAALERGAGRLGRTVGRTLTSGLRYGTIGLGALGAALGGAAVLGVKTAASMETASIGFTTMLGSGRKAAAFLKQLKAFAAATPFEFPELQTAASSLISIGIDSKKVIPIMTTLGNVTAGMGTGSEGIQRATVAIQQMIAANRIQAEDLNQLRDAGIPVYDLLAAAMGKTKAQVAGLAQQGKLGKGALDAMMKALETGKGLERFDGLMEKQSHSLAGVWSTLKDNVQMGLADALKPAIPILKDLVGWAGDKAGVALPRFSHWLRGIVRDGRDLWQTFRAGGIAGVVDELDSMTGAGGRLSAGFRYARRVVNDVVSVVRTGLLPGIRDVTGAIDPAWLTPLGAARAGLHFLAHNGWLVRAAVVALTAALVVNRGVMVASTAMAKAQAAATFIQTATTYGLSYALKAGGTAAKLYAAGQWLVNAAMSANPIGIVVLALAALVGGFIYAYKHSERFRDALSRSWEMVKAGASWLGRLWVKFTPLGQIVQHFGALKRVVSDVVGWLKRIHFPSAPGWLKHGFGNPFGDTAVSRARGHGGGLDRTLAMHSRLSGPGIKVSNALVGGGGRGRGSGDHQAGRALDLVGPGLGAYKSSLERAGGYGAFHGNGAGRHLHAVYPAGDTRTSRTSSTSSPSGEAGGVTYLVPVTVQGNASDVDKAELRRAVRQAIADAERDRLERAGRP